MRNIINMIIKIAIIWGAAWLFPEYVKVQDTRTMVLVVTTILIASIILAVTFRGILWKNNVCKLRAHFRTDDKNIKVLKSLKGVDITPEVPEE